MLLCILQESRWKNSFENLDLKPGVMNIDDLVINTEMKIANGCNAAEIFPGLFHDCKVAVKRVAKHISKNEMQVAHFLCSENLKAEHLFATYCCVGRQLLCLFCHSSLRIQSDGAD